MHLEITGAPASAEVVTIYVDGAPFEIPIAAPDLSLAAGKRRLSGAPLAGNAFPIRDVYGPVFDPDELCVASGEERFVRVEYRKSSGRLWVGGRGFDASVLEDRETSLSSINVKNAGNRATFDRDGNLWAVTMQGDIPGVGRFPRPALEGSGDVLVEADVFISTEGPFSQYDPLLAFDPEGNLWSCHAFTDIVRRYPAASLREGGTVMADITFRGTDNGLGGGFTCHGLAFDAGGNLWVTGEWVYRIKAEWLQQGVEIIVPDFFLPAAHATWIAFDGAGTLWVLDDYLDSLAAYSPASLVGGSSTAGIFVQLPEADFHSDIAFDDSNGLWLVMGGHVGRLSAMQLSTSGAATPELMLDVTTGYWPSLAVYPGPRDLPLHHSLP